ncbi:MAG: hypothetical protein J5706_04580 [Elusimicrobiales bacterium]|nr:hypothetical protein [Elusimicrobiales bacterium]
MSLTKLQQNQIESATVPHLYISRLRDVNAAAYIQITAPVKGTSNTDYFLSFCGTDQSFGFLFDIVGVVNAYIRDGMYSCTFDTDPWGEVEVISSDFISANGNKRIETWCHVDGTSKTWKYRLGGATEWTSGPVLTDTGMDAQDDGPNILGNIRFKDNSACIPVGWDFRVVRDGITVFDARTAVRGQDYEVLNGNDAASVELKYIL